MKNEVVSEFTSWLSDTKAEINKLSIEVSKQSKNATHTAATLQDLLISADNMSENLIRIQSGIIH